MLGGKLLPFFARYRAIARAYCAPRNTSSASFSRCACWRHTGSSALITTAITAIATNTAAIAYPRWPA